MEFARATAGPQVQAPARRPTILGGKLVPNQLHFRDCFQRRREPFTRGPVIVVIEPVNRDVVE